MTEHEVADAAWGAVEPVPTRWSSGRWALEVRGDELADLRCDGVLLARSVRFVARDRDWNTVPARVLDLVTTPEGPKLQLELAGYGARIDARLTITAEADRLAVVVEAVVREPWARNRLGLVLLHPPGVAGTPMRIDHPDGSAEASTFPQHIAPHQPALDIAGLAWSVDGLAVRAEFTGEVFEMEDQRNWTDASFKTYSTPLALPFPVEVAAGTRVEQSIRFEVTGRPADRPSRRRSPVEAVPSGAAFPGIGLGAATEPGEPPRLDAVGTHLVEIDLDAPGWRAALERAVASAVGAGATVDLRLIATRADTVPAAVAAASAAPLERLGVTHARTQVTEPELWDALRRAAAAAVPEVQLVGGARSHFTELNRRIRDLPRDLPALAFALTPQMHASERAQLVESLAMQRLVALDAVRLAAGRAVHVGPVTLRQRYNTVATTPPGPPVPGAGYAVSPDADDPRQSSRALAAWTVASAAALAVPGVASIAWFETWGPRGIRGADGRAYPVAAAIRDLTALAGGERLDVHGEPPDGVWLTGSRRDGVDTLLMANVAPRRAVVDVAGRGDVVLEPFGVAVVR